MRNAEPGMRNVSETTIAQAATVGLSTRKAVDAALDLLESDPARLRPGRSSGVWLEALDTESGLRVTCRRALPSFRSLRRFPRSLGWEAARACCPGPLCACGLPFGWKQPGDHRLVRSPRPFPASVVKFREAVQAATGVSASSIMIACTHAHGTPDTVGCGYEKPGYLDFLVDSVRRAAAEAVGSARPARMGVETRGDSRAGEVQTGQTEGRSGLHGALQRPLDLACRPQPHRGAGPIDPDLNVVRIEDLQGRPIAGLSSFGCHPSIALAANEVTGDFSGEAMAGLERVLGASAVFLCMTGAGGDVDPTLEVPPWGPVISDSAARLGRIFLAQVLEIYERTAVDELSRVQSASRRVSIPAREDWLSLLTEEQERMCQEFAGQWEISQARSGGSRDAAPWTPRVQAVRLGETSSCRSPGRGPGRDGPGDQEPGTRRSDRDRRTGQRRHRLHSHPESV